MTKLSPLVIFILMSPNLFGQQALLKFEDLMSENAQGIHIEMEHGSQPESLTVCEEEIF